MSKLLSIFIMGSEVRQFVHSGLFSLLQESGWEITIMSKIIDNDLHEQIPDGNEIVPLLNVKNPLIANEVTRILDKAFNNRRRRQGRSLWKYGREVSTTWRQSLLFQIEDLCANLLSKSEWLMNFISRLETSLFFNADRRVWREYLLSEKIDAILVNVPTQNIWNLMLTTAKELGIKTYLIYHTSKDIVANGRLNHAFSGIGVWSRQMKEDLQSSNPWINPDTISVVGCGHFDCVGRTDWLPNEAEFRKDIGALLDSLLIIYPTAGPGIVPMEERYIHLVVSAVDKAEKYLNRKIQIVFRMNPMDNREVLFEYLKKSFPEHITLRPDWQDIRKSNWTYARKSDTIFYNALLHSSSLCITIPSTVTVDSAISGLPVINLGIELHGDQPLAGSIQAFWDVDFNRNVRETGAALYVTSEQDLVSAIIEYLQDKSIDEKKREALVQREVNGIHSGRSSQLSCDLINMGR